MALLQEALLLLLRTCKKQIELPDPFEDLDFSRSQSQTLTIGFTENASKGLNKDLDQKIRGLSDELFLAVAKFGEKSPQANAVRSKYNVLKKVVSGAELGIKTMADGEGAFDVQQAKK